jgi:hypothetical protein
VPIVGAFEDVAQRRFTVAEYHRMAETGILRPDERVELVRGVVRRMSPRSGLTSSPHTRSAIG